MLLANEEWLLHLFTEVHGQMSLNCEARVVYVGHEPVGVACYKDGEEAWRITLEQINTDLWVKYFMGELSHGRH